MVETKDFFRAPKGKFRVILQDCRLGINWSLIGDYADWDLAEKKAISKSGDGMVVHIYDDKAEHLQEYGKF